MDNLIQPEILLKPFAKDGDKNNIPLVNNNITNPQLADLTNGFPEITSLPPAQGGLPPERKDFNALGYLTTTYDYYAQAGGVFTFNQTICDAIGGYPLNARLWYTNSDGVSMIVRSTVPNNTNNFITNPSYIGMVGENKPWVRENFLGYVSKGNLFDCKWADHLLNDVSWLRADTFSWQSGSVYVSAYNHLVADYTNGTTQSETISSYTISYKLAPDGHKITTDEENAINIFNATGVAWYYILDTTNTRFKLPRTKFGFMGLRNTVGKYVAAGLPNHNHSYTNVARHGMNGMSATTAYFSNGDSAQGNVTLNTTYASSSNSIYGASSTVQPPATQMYLYFYVGSFNQSAVEQTAGLNTELFNGKVDLNAANLSTQGKALVSGLGMPSSRYIDLTLLVSASQYTAPENGYLLIDMFGQVANEFVYLFNITTALGMQSVRGNGGREIAFVPCKKGDIIQVDYSGTASLCRFRFVYAEGN